MSDQTLKMSSSPHIRDNMTTSKIMLMVVIALLPASAFGIYNFGVPALIMLISTTASAVLTEYIYEKLMHKKITIGDYSAVVTGLLLGLNMPPTAPWWMCIWYLDCKTAFWRSGTELYEPGTWSKMFPFDFFYKSDDDIRL